MNQSDIDRYSKESAACVNQIAKEEGWTQDQLKVAWDYTLPFQKCISEYITVVPHDYMRMGFVIMVEALKGILGGTTQALFEAERGELNEEDFA
jgi:hypothetical protein